MDMNSFINCLVTVLLFLRKTIIKNKKRSCPGIKIYTSDIDRVSPILKVTSASNKDCFIFVVVPVGGDKYLKKKSICHSVIL